MLQNQYVLSITCSLPHRKVRMAAAIFHVHIYLIMYLSTKWGHVIILYSHLKELHLMSNIYAFIACQLRTHPLRESQNCVDFSVSLRTVILVSIDSTSHNASMPLIQYLVSLQFGNAVTN